MSETSNISKTRYRTQDAKTKHISKHTDILKTMSNTRYTNTTHHKHRHTKKKRDINQPIYQTTKAAEKLEISRNSRCQQTQNKKQDIKQLKITKNKIAQQKQIYQKTSKRRAQYFKNKVSNNKIFIIKKHQHIEQHKITTNSIYQTQDVKHKISRSSRHQKS